MLNTAKQTVQKAATKIEAVSTNNPVTKVARTAVLAGMGTFVLGREELDSFVAKLVEKGELTEKESRKLVSDLLEQPQVRVNEVEEKVESLLDARINSILDTMNLPGKKDIDALSRKISVLSKKVAELDEKLAAEEKKAA